jgi:hypothetical protein
MGDFQEDDNWGMAQKVMSAGGVCRDFNRKKQQLISGVYLRNLWCVFATIKKTKKSRAGSRATWTWIPLGQVKLDCRVLEIRP